MAKAKLGTDNHLIFFCPGCNEHHAVTVNSDHGWKWDQSLDSPTLEPSILVRGGHYAPEWKSGDACWCTYAAEHGGESPFACAQCHSYVEAGKIRFLDDCSHDLKGTTVELPDIDALQ